MLIIFSLLLLFSVGRSVDGLRLETKTIGAGDALTLTCPRQKSNHSLSYTYLFWTRFIPGSLPEVLGGTFSFDYDIVNNNFHFITKQKPNGFVLQIHQTQLSDTGFYYCITVKQRHMTFIKRIFLTIKDASGTDQYFSGGLQIPPSESARSVTVQCSVPSGSENRTCPGEHSLYWFKVGPNETPPRLVYTHENSEDECELSPEQPASEECVYNLSTIIHSADAGTYSCAVVTCGEVMFGKVTQLDIQVSGSSSLPSNAVNYLLCGLLAINLILVSILIYTQQTNKCDSCNDSASGNFQSRFGQNIQQKDTHMNVYSAVTFAIMKTDKDTVKDSQSAETQRIYRALKAFGLD